MFGGMRHGEPWITKAAADSIDPPRVETALLGLARAWAQKSPALREVIESFPLGENNLIHLLAVSDISTQRLQAEPQILSWLSRKEIVMSAGGYGEKLVGFARLPGQSLP